jgi:hypothetical protein
VHDTKEHNNQSNHYIISVFHSLQSVCQACNWLLILNLLSLMGDAGIEGISHKSDLGHELAKMEEKFRLELTEELADERRLS